MTEQPQTPDRQPDATAIQPPAGAAAVDERPELAVGAAFAGGFLLALVLKRLAR